MSSSLRIYQSSFVGYVIFFVIRNSLIIFLLLSILLVLVSKYSEEFDRVVSGLAVEVTKPIFLLVSSPVNIYTESKLYFQNLSRLSSENKILKEDNSHLRNEILQLTYLDRENKILKDLLKYKPSNKMSFFTSRIFVSSNDPFSKLAIIDHGVGDDIQIGQAIITSEGLVGRVIKTSINHSHILLLNDLNSKIPVYTSSSGEKAIMVGRSSSYPRLQYLGPKHRVSSDEVIYTSGDGLMYPSDIPVGITLLHENNEVEVIPFVDFSKLKFVKVVLSDVGF